MKREHNEHEPVVDDAAAARVLDRVLALPPTEDERDVLQSDV